MKPGSRDDRGTRLHAEQQFRERAIQILVATAVRVPEVGEFLPSGFTADIRE
ncbi:MAG TPA: hypothetical protein VNO43_12290 [Candidatus Eisenbacteria bacterium]|nr:hypothetical protein [Candidatus Eisenbacteria bacterium]